MAFALDSPEREKREGSTAPCGAKDVVGPSFRAQSDWLRGESRMPNSTDNIAYKWSPLIRGNTNTKNSEIFTFFFLSPPEGGLDLVTNRKGAI